MKKIFYLIIVIAISGLVVINLSCLEKRKCLKTMQNDYSFIIGKKIDFTTIDTTQHDLEDTSTYILSIITPTCEDCYVKINKWSHLVDENQHLKVIFVVTGDEFERLDEIVKEKKDLHFLFDYDSVFQKKNPHILLSQTYLIENNTIILCGEPLQNKMVMNIFMDYIK